MTALRALLAPLLFVALLAVLIGPRGHGPEPASGADYDYAGNGGHFPLAAALVRAPLQFDPAVAPADREAVLAAIARARPEARRLIALIDGAVTVHVGPAGPGAAGQASTTGNGRYRLDLDLGPVYRSNGDRGVSRVVLHELGHVVDYALVDDALAVRLDAQVPPNFPCGTPGGVPICASSAERFAETFAKWASGDLGVNVYEGYRVPPPASLDEWGAPLAALGR